MKKFKNLFLTIFFAKTGWDRPRKRKKKFNFRIPFILDRGKKIPKKIAKKLKKFKNLFLTLFFAKTGWDRPRWRKKKFYFRIPSILDSGEKILKKIAKKLKKLRNISPILFLPKRDEIGREKEKKILLSNSVHTRLVQENSEKNSKKIEKIEKPLSDIIS